MKSFNEKIVDEVIKYSKLYKENLMDFEYLIISKKFKISKFYIIHCKDENYLHLTGIRSRLKAVDFFNKCYNGSLKLEELDFGKNANQKKYIKGTVRRKIKVLENMINSFYNKELYFEEKFEKNKVFCDIATCDFKCTLRFIGKEKSRPMTLLSGDMLKKPNKIDIIMRRKKGQEKFDEIICGDKDLVDEYKNILEGLIFYKKE